MRSLKIPVIRNRRQVVQETLIDQVPDILWKAEFEKSSYKYHKVAAIAAIIFDPIFGITDYYNIPNSWSNVLVLRVLASIFILIPLLLRKRYPIPSAVIAIVPFTLISFQNAYTYSLIGNDQLLGHNLNYMALIIGAGMFVAWKLEYSVVAIITSAIATSYFILTNHSLSIDLFFVNGGLLLIASGFFMTMLIRTRYNLTVKEIKARMALHISNESIRIQNEEIKSQNNEIKEQTEEIKQINENLENLVSLRTKEIEKKNQALEEYAFINAHKLRSPVASILGLTNLIKKIPTSEEAQPIIEHLHLSAEKLDEIVNSITKAIERGDKK